MKRSMLLIACVLVGLPLYGQIVSVAEFDHPPFAYLDAATKLPAGAEAGYITAVLREAGYQAKFNFVPFPRMLALLQSGEADIGPLLVKTPQREADIAFPSQPALKMTAVLIVPKNSALGKLNTRDDVKSLRLGIGNGITVPKFFAENQAFDYAAGTNPTEANLTKLLGSRIDGAVELNPYSALLELKKLNAVDKVRLIDIPGSDTFFYLTISKKSKLAAELLPAINSVLGKSKISMETLLKNEMK